MRLIWKPSHSEGKYNPLLSSAESLVWSWRPSQNSGSQARLSFYKSMLDVPRHFPIFPMPAHGILGLFASYTHPPFLLKPKDTENTRIIDLVLNYLGKLGVYSPASLKHLSRLLKECTWKCNWWVKMSIAKDTSVPCK